MVIFRHRGLVDDTRFVTRDKFEVYIVQQCRRVVGYSFHDNNRSKISIPLAPNLLNSVSWFKWIDTLCSHV